MKKRFLFVALLILDSQLVMSQVKFLVKKLNADSLAALLLEKEGTEHVEVLNLFSNVICRKDIDSSACPSIG